MSESARAKLRGENVDEVQMPQDRDVIDRWAEAEGVDLDSRAEEAKEKLSRVNGAK